ncbi:fimbrillin family protein [Parabacteroides sp.]
MKKNLFQISLLLSLCAAFLCGCTDDDDPIAVTDGTTLTIHATANGFTSTDGVNTRAAESGYATTFTTGDAIGVFAVKNNQIIADCKNVKCTYSADGSWTADASAPVYYYTDAQYFAYYPYKSELSAENITDVSGIVDYFNKNIATDQGTYAKYTACDLMTATATVSTATSGGNKSLSFSFAHQMSLIEISLPVQKYKTADTEGAYEYSFPVIGATFSITKEGSTPPTPVTPCSMGSGVYRYIVPAGTACTVSGEFPAGDKTIEYSQSVTSLSSGKYKRLNVTYNGAPTTPISRALAIGDFYYSDGSIYPNDANGTPTEGCVGVIYCVSNRFITDSSTNKTAGGYTHALVVALKDASTSSTWDNAGSAVSGYQKAVAAPSGSSNWYLPNIDELRYICRGSDYTNGSIYPTPAISGKTTLNAQFQKLNSESVNLFGDNFYWSSTYYGISNAGSFKLYHAVEFNAGGGALNDKNNSHIVRCSLAF